MGWRARVRTKVEDIIDEVLQSELVRSLEKRKHRIYRKLHVHRKNGVGYIKRNGSYEAVIFKNGVVVSTFDESVT